MEKINSNCQKISIDPKLNINSNQYVWTELETGNFITVQRLINHKTLVSGEQGINETKQEFISRKKIQSQNLEINQTAYHKKHGYVILERDNNVQAKIDMGSNIDLTKLPNTWECVVLNASDQKIDQQQKIEEPKKVNIKASELNFLIQIETVCTIENQVTIQKHKVNIKDPILSLIQPMRKLYLSKLSAFLFEKELDLNKTFIQEQIDNNQKIVLHGVRTDQSLEAEQSKFFQRFTSCNREGGWGQYGDMDGIKILCYKSIMFQGVGIFEESNTDQPEPFTLSYKYSLIDQFGSDIYKSELIKEEVKYSSADVNELHFFKYKFKTFPKGIKVEAGQTIYYQQLTSLPQTYYSDSGLEYEMIQNPDMGIFKLKNGENSESSTSVSDGLIPGFLYQLC
ncbi:UNKNOWN [Stylonychia lemnae]|uniref:PHR domain-containing protein n=1 Tax=Stylonychia lemnae TaxID=5949 RepID=A0A078A8N9_STYLE|nr:UNKNOWN [Stylonychia lemnae]|eukprot:CDW78594.1 UNKNOWN [Stylonychia lemnae]